MAASHNSFAVRTEALVKCFGTNRAVDGVDLEIPTGTVLGLLGPNGAGKTTIVRMITTLLPPDSGSAWVAGHDVTSEPDAVRRSIGMSGQYAAVDENLTGYENLYLVGRLYGFSRKQSALRARELLERFGISDAGDRPSKTYSGGMRRRLDLAGALVARPTVVVLDEPTTGLDPRGRMETWEVIGDLVTDGTTVLLTTQYLEEADHLADTIVVIDHGKVIARGSADELKTRTGGERLELVVGEAVDLPIAGKALADVGTDTPAVDEQALRVSVLVDGGAKALMEALRRLDADNVEVHDVALRRPSLDDVFLSLTGRLPDNDAEAAANQATEGAVR